jgi:di/tricarboxylate transporter
MQHGNQTSVRTAHAFKHHFCCCCCFTRCGISPKKLLIPMSFATVLGGTVTLIGTSTNLVVSGLQEEKYGATDPSKVFSFFTITPYGELNAIPACLLLLLLLLLLLR